MRSRIITPGGGLVDPYGRLLSRSGGLLRERYGGAQGPVPLFDLSFGSGPSDQPFATAGATSEWTFQEASGTIYDQIGSYDLSSFGGTYYHDQPANGITSSPTARRAFELRQGAGGYAATTSYSQLDADGASLGIRVVFRCLYPYSGTLIYKRDLAGSSNGYSLSFNTSGHLTLYAHDGTSFVTAAVAQNHCDAAWHYVDIVIDETADEIRIRTDLGSATTSKAALGSLTSVLQNFTLGDAGAGINAPQVQYTYMAAIEGAAAEGLDSQSFWAHGSKPSLLSNYSRSSSCMDDIGDNKLASWGVDQCAIGWNNAFRSGSFYGLSCWPAATNLLADSCNLASSNWTASGLTKSGGETEDILGFHQGTSLTASAANDYLYQAVTTSAGTSYVASVYIKQHASHPTAAGRIILHDGTSEVASEFFITTTEWRRVWVAGSHGGTTTQVRIELDDGTGYGEIVYAFGAQLEVGTEPTPLILTGAIAATRAAADPYTANMVSSGYLDHAAGEIEATLAMQHGFGVTDTFLDLRGASAADQKLLYTGASVKPNFDIYNSSGLLAQSCGGASAEIVEGSELFRGRWDSAGGVDGNSENADILADGVRDAGSASTWTPGATEQTLYLGRGYSGSNRMSGHIQRVRTWATPQAEGAFGWNRFDDAFDGAGTLNKNWLAYQQARVPQVQEVGGRYRALVTNNLLDQSLWYNAAQGRMDYKRLKYPFEVIAYNVGIGTVGDSQVAPSATPTATYFFCGLVVHTDPMSTVDYQAILVGHRGPTHYTLEFKNTSGGTSNVADAGANAAPNGRADLRVVMSAGGVCTFYWKLPGAPTWTLSGHTGSSIPTYSSTFVNVGLVTYAYLGYGGLPFVGTCDGIELV